MQAPATRLTGAGAGAKKYDVLSALALAGLDNAALPSQRALRLIALITMRYNWAADVLSIGHTELERIWSVSKRTVIREMDALRSLGLLVVLRRGRKGKVTTYRLDISAVRRLAADELVNDATGIDSRLSATHEVTAVDGETCSSIHKHTETVPDKTSDNPLWETILKRLPDTVSSAQKARWLAPLRIRKISETLEVEVGSAFRAEYVSRTFGDQLQSAARSLGIKRVALVGAPSDTHGTSFADAAG